MAEARMGMHTLRFATVALAGLALAGCSKPAKADLAGYLARPEPAYSWKQVSFRESAAGSEQVLSMVSQTWQGGVWRHRVAVFRPAKPAHPEMCLLFNTGGDGVGSEAAVGAAAAQMTGCTVAILGGIPNQPLYGKSEDALIVYSWRKYVETGDETWPLQFPMVKSVVKAMDAIQASAASAGQPDVTRFTIAGASKRGWTAWLAAASGDKRIAAIVPMVIDILNMPAQIAHQRVMYGTTSEMIHDYSEGGVLDIMDTPGGKRIVEMVDPYSYRARLTLPKLLVLGTNDRYWSQDALNLYWDDLKGPKWVLYTPNSGHGLEDQTRVFATVASFVRSVASGTPMPRPVWTWKDAEDGAALTVNSDQPLVSARLFRAESGSTDFRRARWKSVEIPVTGTSFTTTAPNPRKGHAATFAELTYKQDGQAFTVSTQIRILSAPVAP